jgi:hypothetical protein
LFATALGADSVERALDLVSLLHSEKSYEILMTVADQLGQHKVTGKIQLMLEARFPPMVLSEDEQDNNSMHYEDNDDNEDQWSDHGGGGGDVSEDPFMEPVSQQTTLPSSRRQRVSPNERYHESQTTPSPQGSVSSSSSNHNHKRPLDDLPQGGRGSFADDLEEEFELPQPPVPVMIKKQKTNNTNIFAKKNKNIFAKSVMQSPTKPITKKSRLGGAMSASPPRKQLSRQSTFSAKAKEKKNFMKHFL